MSEGSDEVETIDAPRISTGVEGLDVILDGGVDETGSTSMRAAPALAKQR